jgi:hypothetical protein
MVKVIKLNPPEGSTVASELERFKTDIDLRAYAAGQGYELDLKCSWRGSAVMRHVSGDKIIISREDDGHYVYWSVRNDSDHGTIIDFVKCRQNGANLCQIRKQLRAWAGSPAGVAHVRLPPLRKTAKSRRRIQCRYDSMNVAPSNAYLHKERSIPSLASQYWRFDDTVRTDRRGNAVFPHYDTEGLCGYEIKNTGFTGFAPGGTKGLWLSKKIREDHRLVICESAIDALSHAILFQDCRTRYASIAGKPTSFQLNLLQVEIERMPVGSEIVAAMDSDQAGRALADLVHRSVEASCRADVTFRKDEPKGFKDWNDQLKSQKHARGTGPDSVADLQR